MTSKQLRDSILQAAIQGQLVPQEPSDTPAALLLERIQAERERLIKERKIRRDKNASVIYRTDEGSYYERILASGEETCIDEEIPFDIPDSWQWSRGRDLFAPMKSKKPIGEKFTYIDLDAIDNKRNTISNPKEVLSSKAPSRASRALEENCILFSLVRPYLRNIAFVSSEFKDAIASTGFYVINPYPSLYAQYIFRLSLSPYVVDGLNQYLKGENSPSINNGHIENFLFPIPPLEEQERIVARIEELMTLVDQYDQAKVALDELESTLPDMLQQSILQAAIQGQLVPQEPSDTPAALLLERIQAERERLIEEKKIRRDKNASIIYRTDEGSYYERNLTSGEETCIDDEIPFDIPDSWQWTRLGNVVTVKGGKRVPNGYKLLDKPTPHIYIRVTDMKDGTLSTLDLKYIDEDVFEGIKAYTISKDDLYLTIAGTIGRVGFVPPFFDGMNLTENAVKLTHILMSKPLLYHFICSDFIQSQFHKKTNQVAQPKLAISRITSSLIPIPPLEEQERIVARIEELMRYTDRLKSFTTPD